MSIGSPTRCGAVLLILVVVHSIGLTDAVLTNKAGRRNPQIADTNTAEALPSRILYARDGPRLENYGRVNKKEKRLIGEFIKYPGDAVISAQTTLRKMKPKALFRLVKVAYEYDIPSLMNAILFSADILGVMLSSNLCERVESDDPVVYQKMKIAEQVLKFDHGEDGDVNLVNTETYSYAEYGGFSTLKPVNVLQHAILAGDTPLVQTLLTRVPGINVNVLSGHFPQATPLMMAIGKNSIDVVRMLLEVPGIELDKHNECGETALFYAVYRNRVDIAELLVDAGIDVHIADAFRASPLHMAARRNNVDMTALLVKAGINVTIVNRHGESSLHVAAMHNSVDVAKWLVKAGIDVTILDGEGASPLHKAVRWHREDMVKYLVTLDGIKVNLPNENGRTRQAVAEFLRDVELLNAAGTSMDAHVTGAVDGAIQAQRQ